MKSNIFIVVGCAVGMLMLAWFVLAPSRAAGQTARDGSLVKYEYLFISDVVPGESAEKLNKAGLEGWEAAAVYGDHFLMKRPLTK